MKYKIIINKDVEEETVNPIKNSSPRFIMERGLFYFAKIRESLVIFKIFLINFPSIIKSAPHKD